MKMQLYDELVWRGLIKEVSDPEVEKKLNTESVNFYIGTDPTGDSLHIGHLSSFLICNRLKNAGHNPYILIGGGTGLIGDPKPDAERPMITKEEVLHNCDDLTKQIKEIFGFEVVNNYDWLMDINFIDYLRDYGKHFPLGYMLNKDIVKRRMEEGITYTEFSYMLMQAVDFLYLYENKNITFQVAGQDQWGNITAGIELIRKKIGKRAYGLTMPLLLRKDGTIFGKTASGTSVWLSKDRTPVYDFYQFFYNTDDDVVIDYLKRFTFLSKEEIDSIEEEHLKHPEQRLASKTLAYEITKFVHGEDEADLAKKTSEEIFTSGVASNMPSIEITKNAEYHILDLLVDSELVASKSEARRLIEQGGISLDSNKITDVNYLVKDMDEVIIQRGKKTYLKVIFK